MFCAARHATHAQVTVKLKDLGFDDEGHVSGGRRLAQTKAADGVRGINEWLNGASPSDRESFQALSGTSRQPDTAVRPSPPLTLSALSGRRLLAGAVASGQGSAFKKPAEEPVVAPLDSSSKKGSLDSWAASASTASKQDLEVIGALPMKGSAAPAGVKIAELGLDRAG